jgi:hypothetical protein
VPTRRASGRWSSWPGRVEALRPLRRRSGRGSECRRLRRVARLVK